MTLTKRTCSLLLAAIMLLGLFLLPQPAKAAISAPSGLKIYARDAAGGFRLEFDAPAGATTYTVTLTKRNNGDVSIVLHTGAATGVTSGRTYINISAGGHYVAGDKCTFQITATNNALETSSPIITGPFEAGKPNISVSLNYSWLVSITGLSGGSSTTFPTYVFYNDSITFYASPSSSSYLYSGRLINKYASSPGSLAMDNTGKYTLSGITGDVTLYAGNNKEGSIIEIDPTLHVTGPYTYSGSGTAKFTIAAPKQSLNRIGVDRQLLSEGEHYTVAQAKTSGNNNKTEITFTEDFLNSLTTGYHEFTFSFEGGTGYATINVAGKATGSGGSTGDGTALRSLSVYSKASSSGKKLGSYSKGAALDVVTFTSSGSYAVVNFGGTEGYVKADYVDVILEDELTGRTSTSTYLYTEKSTKSKYRYAQVSKGTALTLLAREGTYWLVNFNDDILYVRAKYVKNLTVG